MYRGTSFSGKIFDTNMDSSFRHTEPLSYTIGTGGNIKGFDEGILMLKKGAVAKIYIPSMIAFGPTPGSELIKPFENVVFDVTVTDVQDKAPQAPVQKPPVKNIDKAQQKK